MHTPRQVALQSLRVYDTGVPIYVQLRDQLLRTIGAGRLAPGERMPTLREVAVHLRVDLNTVRRAYDALERAGAITLHRGRGSFVAEAPPPADGVGHAARLDALARDTLAAAAACGVDPAGLAARLLQLFEGTEP